MKENNFIKDKLNGQHGNLPLPDIDMAWNDMRRRLDKDDERRPVAWWQKPGILSLIFGSIALLGIIGLYLVFNTPSKQPTEQLSINKPTLSSSQNSLPAEQALSPIDNELNHNAESIRSTSNPRPSQINYSNKNSSASAQLSTLSLQINPDQSLNDQSKNTIKAKAKAKTKTNIQTAVATSSSNETEVIERSNISASQNETTKNDEDFIAVANTNEKPLDSLTAKTNLSNIETKSVDSGLTKTKISAPNPKKWSFSAGLTLYQSVPVAGQKLSYQSAGEAGMLKDYLPGAFFTVQYNKKWNIVTGFRYGAPQYLRNRTLTEYYKHDISNYPYTVKLTNINSSKAYYHQVPLLITYQITPAISAGGGVQWNSFHTAVTHQTIGYTAALTRAPGIMFNKEIIEEPALVSNIFKSSYFSSMATIAYTHKAWTLGLQYGAGMKPAMEIPQPGTLRKQLIAFRTMDLYLRYQLWHK